MRVAALTEQAVDAILAEVANVTTRLRSGRLLEPPVTLPVVQGVSLAAMVEQRFGRAGGDRHRHFVELCELIMLMGPEEVPLYVASPSGEWHRVAWRKGGLEEVSFNNTLRGAWLEDADLMGVNLFDAVLKLEHVFRPRLKAAMQPTAKGRQQVEFTFEEQQQVLHEWQLILAAEPSQTRAHEVLMRKWPELCPGRAPISRQALLNNIKRWKAARGQTWFGSRQA